MNGVSELNRVVEYIENNIFGEIDVGFLAQMTGLSVYEFRRIFSFVAGTPVNEYIRKRRMSLAAEKILSGENSVVNLAVICGYDSPSSFSRAFKDFHGFSPNETLKNTDKIKTFTKVSFVAQVRGGGSVDYKLVEFEPFVVFGIKGESDMNDTECCESVWQKYYASEFATRMESCGKDIYALYFNGEKAVECLIGEKTSLTTEEEKDDAGKLVQKNPDIPDIYKYVFEKTLWAEFSICGSNDEIVNKFYDEVLGNWFESTNYERNKALPNLEIFPSDMSSSDFEWKILIPVLRKKQ